MQLQIITTEKELFNGEVTMVQVPGSKGAFEILKNHAPIISTLNPGTIRAVLKQGGEEHFDISGGVVESSDNSIVVLADM